MSISYFLVLALSSYLYFSLITSTVLADFTFSLPQTSFEKNQEIEAEVSLQLKNSANKTYYLEGAFIKEGQNHYFGLTWNDVEWIKYTNSGFSLLKKITTDQAGKWQGKVRTKVDQDSSYYSGGGEYHLFIKRFTTGGTPYPSENSIKVTILDNSPPNPSPTSSADPFPLSTPSPASEDLSLAISNLPQTINSDQAFTLKVEISDLEKGSQNFIKGAFLKSGSTNYFGKTKVGDSWIKNSQSSKSQFPLTADSSGKWQGNLEVIADPEDSGYSGAGDYLFKVALYGNEGKLIKWSNQEKILIKQATSSNSTPLPTSKKTPIPSKTSSTSQNKTSISSPNQDIQIAQSLLPNNASVAGAKALVAEKNQKNFFPKIFLISGVLLIITGLGSLAYFWKKH